MTLKIPSLERPITRDEIIEILKAGWSVRWVPFKLLEPKQRSHMTPGERTLMIGDGSWCFDVEREIPELYFVQTMMQMRRDGILECTESRATQVGRYSLANQPVEVMEK